MSESTAKVQLKGLIEEFGISSIHNLLSIAYAELCNGESEAETQSVSKSD